LAEPEGLRAQLALQRLAEQVPPTEFEKSTYPDRPTVRRYEKIIRFSTVAPVKAGWLVKDHGLWTVTEEGQKAYANLPDPEAFVHESNRLYRQWRSSRPDPAPESSVDELDDEAVVVTTTYEEAEEAAWAEIEARLGTSIPMISRMSSQDCYTAWAIMSLGRRPLVQIEALMSSRLAIRWGSKDHA
jgi:restriction system protein